MDYNEEDILVTPVQYDVLPQSFEDFEDTLHKSSAGRMAVC